MLCLLFANFAALLAKFVKGNEKQNLNKLCDMIGESGVEPYINI